MKFIYRLEIFFKTFSTAEKNDLELLKHKLGFGGIQGRIRMYRINGSSYMYLTTNRRL